MSVVISGALTDGAGIPMSGYHIILKSRVNTPSVAEQEGQLIETEATGAPQKHHHTLNQ
ncbi:tail fiber protein [Shigella sonnei]|nr:prophage tail fiber N-terminal domain-containing protein [Shigella sonnei]SJE50779.1 tail fiber protein [Shigella sonnei]